MKVNTKTFFWNEALQIWITLPLTFKLLELDTFRGGTLVCRPKIQRLRAKHTSLQVEMPMAEDQIKSRPYVCYLGSQTWSPARQAHRFRAIQENLWNTAASSGFLPMPPWCHFQTHYIPMTLGSFNYMWWSLALLELDGLCWRFIGLSFHASRVINNTK